MLKYLINVLFKLSIGFNVTVKLIINQYINTAGEIVVGVGEGVAYSIGYIMQYSNLGVSLKMTRLGLLELSLR